MKGSGRTGRRPGVSGSREKILSAARVEFGARGYDGATMLRIAARAGCDTALIHHFFGTKERLFDEAMALPVRIPEHLPELLADPGRMGENIARNFLESWESGSSRQVMLGLLRSAVSNERAAGKVREMAVRQAVTPMLDVIDVPDAEFRAALIGSHLVGLMLARHITRIEPIASVPIEEIVRAIAPTLQHYITGDVGHGKPQPPCSS